MLTRRDKMLWFSGALAVMVVAGRSALSQNRNSDSYFSYRGFSIDVSGIVDASDSGEIKSSLKHQIDIVADCGARPDIIDFFRAQKIAVNHIRGDEPGTFLLGRGVEIDAAPQPFQKPILLHELLHAYHVLILPNGVQNSDVLMFFNNAVRGLRYPPANRKDTYVLKNAKEFFAVTASLYLWGSVDRQPYNRENLRSSQPRYYEWLGQQFGVHK